MAKDKWTTNNIPDLTGKTILVTGGNSGLGFEAVKMFAEKNAHVILASRSEEKGRQARFDILASYPRAIVEVQQLDLGSLKSVGEFADNIRRQYDRLDILLNNAGIMWCPYAQTEDGLESQMGVNHFGHFALTGRLLGILKKTPGSRVVNVSSLGHRRAEFDMANPMFNEDNYDPNVAYFNSKLANLLFTYELQRRLEKSDQDIISVAAHPGGSATNLSRHIEQKFWFVFLKPLLLLLAQSAAQGTLPEVRASVDPQVKGGQYYGPDGFNEMGGNPVLVNSTQISHNHALAKNLWEYSEKLTGVKFDFT